METDNDEEVRHISSLVADMCFDLGEFSYEADFASDVSIDRHNLSEEYVKHSESFAWYATAYEFAQDQEAKAKSLLELVDAKLDHGARMELQSAGIKFTEKMIHNTVISQPQHQQAEEAYFRAKKLVGMLRACRDAMIHRKDMLVSLGANYRAEGASAFVLNEKDKTSAAKDALAAALKKEKNNT